jgi:hypothetical protein
MLTFLDALRWDMLADGIQVLLCGVILVCLVHNKLKYKRLLPEAPRRGAPPVFSQEVLLQTLRQQAEQALASIRAAVDAEEVNLQQFVGAAGVPRPVEPASAAEIPADHIPFRLGGGEPAGLGTLPGRCAGLGELAAQGLTPRQIAAQTGRPAGEIELALKLQRAAVEAGAAAATRQ